jgi:hypothetical protein
MNTPVPGEEPSISQLRKLGASADAMIDDLLEQYFEGFSHGYPETAAWRKRGRNGSAPADGSRDVLNAARRAALRLVVLGEGRP